MSEPPPEGFQLSADDPMLEQIEAATTGNRQDSGEVEERDDNGLRMGEPVGAEAGMGERNSFEPEEITDDPAE